MKTPRVKSSVGIRELKNHASAVLRRVRGGETVTLTDRNQPVALLVPIGAQGEEERVRQLVRAGRLTWSGGKPTGSHRPPTIRGASVADAVIEDRR